jgi:hypothetical protein
MNNHARKYYDTLIASMPAGIERALIRVLSGHIGKDNAISKAQLITDLSKLGFHVAERQVRSEITELRKQGLLICSSSGDGGYFFAETPEEYEEFVQVEYRAKIIDMSETVRAMDDGARQVFSVPAEAAKQPGLF